MRTLSMSFAFTCLLSVAASHAEAADRVTGKPFATRSEIYAPKAMAATSHPLATQIALQTMRDGGSAVDAAIAANAALGLMEPTGNGIGGDLFAIVWDPKTRKLQGYNGSGRSPKALTLDEFKNGWESAREQNILGRLETQFRAADKDKSGLIEAVEFANLPLIKRAGSGAPPMSAFDANRDQKLDFKEYLDLVPAMLKRLAPTKK